MFDSFAFNRSGSASSARMAEDLGVAVGGRSSSAFSSFGLVDTYSPCGCCGTWHAAFDGAGDPIGVALNADDRGVFGPNGKPSLSTTDAGGQITRTNLRWGTPGDMGGPAVVTFSFRSTAPATMPTDTTGFSRFTEAQINATLLALQAWSDVANIVFQRVGEGTSGDAAYSNDATMVFGNYSEGQDGAAAFAYLPGSAGFSANAGDVWINSSLSYNAVPVPLAYGQHALLHEIGHAIGLSHPAAYNASAGVTITYAQHATYFEDSRQYTVMSYFSETNTGGAFGGRYAAAPLLDDISAVQRLYGANMETRTGDTVYGFNSNAGRIWYNANNAGSPLIFAVWDAGGNDTFDFSGYLENQLIDLRQGAFSNVGALTGNVAIAIGAVIENAIGGSGNDVIVGNAADNRLTGGAGNDRIDGGLGIDTVVFSGPRSAYTITWNGQIGTVVGPDGTDTVTNVEFLQFSDQTIAAQPTGGLTVAGDITDNTMNGTAFRDVLAGMGGDDVLNGLGGDDFLDGGSGDDVLNGGDGNDILIGGLGDDTLNGGAGWDIADYSGAGGGVTVNLAAGTSSGAAGNDTLISIEEVIGSVHDDVLTGDNGNNILRGGGGADILNGGGGSDRLYAGAAALRGAGDVVKTAATANNNSISAVSLDANFDLMDRPDVANATTIPHATVRAVTHGGMEYYAFTVSAGAEVTFDIDNAAFDTVLHVYNNMGAMLAFNDDGGTDGGASTDSGFSHVFAEAGTYYVRVSEWASGSGATLGTRAPASGLAYTLHVSVPGHTVVPVVMRGSTLNGGDGDDFLYGGDGDDVLNGGAGWDAADYSAAAGGVTVNLLTGQASGAMGNDTLSGIEEVRGSAHADVLTGDNGANALYGGAGNDVLRGNGGNDLLDGGAGFDTAAYVGVRRQYTANSSQVSGREGTDTLVSIEQLQFTDGVLTFDVNSQAAQVMRMYNAALSRQPDQGGFENWLDRLEGGQTLLSMAQSFLNSAEFQSRFGGLSNEQYVAQLYRVTLGREPDAGGLAHWTGLLDSGERTRTQMLVSFSESAEHKGRTQTILDRGLWVADEDAKIIARLYDATFDRLPDAGGLATWTQALKNGRPLVEIAGLFAASAEFQQRYGQLSNSEFIAQMYRFTLNREADAAGLAHWTARLDTGERTRAQVLLAFSESAEHIAITHNLWLGGIRTLDTASGAPLEDAGGKAADGPQVLPGDVVVEAESKPGEDADQPLVNGGPGRDGRDDDVQIQAEDEGAQVLPAQAGDADDNADAGAPEVLPAEPESGTESGAEAGAKAAADGPEVLPAGEDRQPDPTTVDADAFILVKDLVADPEVLPGADPAFEFFQPDWAADWADRVGDGDVILTVTDPANPDPAPLRQTDGDHWFA